MYRYFSLVIFGLNAFVSNAQPFYKYTYLSINQNQISAAFTRDSGFITSNMVKYNAAGDTQWSKLYMLLEPSTIIEANDTGFTLTGKTNNYGVTNESVILIKTNKTGTTNWAKSYDMGFKSLGKRIKQTLDDGYIVATTSNKAIGQNDIILIKTNSIGDTSWVKRYEFGNNTNVEDILQTTDSGYIVVGTSNGAISKTLFFRITAVGNIIWSKEVFSGAPAGRYFETAKNILTLPGGFMITSNLRDTSNISTMGYDIAFYKIDLNGNILSSRQSGIVFGYGLESQHSTLTKDGCILTVGKVNPYLNDKSSNTMVALKTDTSGNIRWLHAYGRKDYFSNLFFGKENTDTTCTLIGTATISPTETGLSLIRTDKDGALPCWDSIFAKVATTVSYTISNISVTVKYNPLIIQNFSPIHTSGCTAKTICSYNGIGNIKNKKQNITLYPNPSNGIFNLSLIDDNNIDASIEIRNTLGQSVYKKVIMLSRGKNIIPIQTELGNGIYQLRILSGNKQYTQVIQVEN